MALLKRSFDDVYKTIREYFSRIGSNAVNISGTPENAIAHFTANEISGLYNSMDYLAEGLNLSTAGGIDLDTIAEQYGIVRGMSSAAADTSKTNVKFYINPRYSGNALDLAASVGLSGITIPAGTEISDGGTIYYYTTTDIVFGEDKDALGNPNYMAVFANVVAYGIGDGYNVNAGELREHNLKLDAQLGGIANQINVTNLLPITNGSDYESDEDLRYRISKSFTTNAQGNRNSIIAAARSISGVSGALVVDNLYGTGTFGVFVDSTSPVISPGIISAVQATVDAVKSAGTRAFVLYPDYVGLMIKYEVMYHDETKIEQTNTDIVGKITDYVNNLKRGETLFINKIENIIFGNSNVKNAEHKFWKSGSYDVLRQTIDNSVTLMPVDQTIGLTEKWFTSSSLIEICQV